MSQSEKLKPLIIKAIQDSFHIDIPENSLVIQETKPDFTGDYTLVLFGIVKQIGKPLNEIGETLGQKILELNPDLIRSFNVIKGFLNLELSDNSWFEFLFKQRNNNQATKTNLIPKKIMVEYSSPNTNKPLHLGHLRNIFLGWSIAEMEKYVGNEVIKSCVVNDRGIHISKSMIAWKQFANGETPESTQTKGDHFVGDYYVKFNDQYKQEIADLINSGIEKEKAEKEAPLMKAAQQMLLDWESAKTDVIDLWKKMNAWVYQGFDQTYNRIGADFDKVYYESETYLLGKEFVEEGLKSGVFYRKDDGSVWIDLTEDGLDEKLVLRKDGTSVYITQDLGLAQQKFDQFKYDQSIYVIADEQNYHMKVLKLILQKLGKPYANDIFHLSYGMVELPSGRMKSREGTVVDADDIVNEMVAVAKAKTEELGKVNDFTDEERTELYETLALGALKFFLLRVDPKKKMIFNPEESIDFHGFTGPFVQYTHARIKSILRKESPAVNFAFSESNLEPKEKEVIVLLEKFETIVAQAITERNPSLIAIYVFNLAKSFNSFYAEHSVVNAESESKKQLRLLICQQTAITIATGMKQLGIKVPERM